MRKIILIAICLHGLLIQAQPSFQFAKQFGDILFDQGCSITTDNLGNSYTAGRFYGTVDFDPGPGVFNLTCAATNYGGIFILKLDASGNFIWAKSIDKINDNVYIALDAVNNIYITGGFLNQITDFDPGASTYTLNSVNGSVFVVKLNSGGNFIWAKQMSFSIGYPTGIAVEASGNVHTIGNFEQTGDFDPGPGVYNLTSNGGTFISKLDANGVFIWAKQLEPNASDQIFSKDIKADNTGNIYLTGWVRGTTDFDPGPAIYTLTTFLNEAFILKLNSSGNFIWAKSIQCNSVSVGSSLAVEPSGNVFLGGYFSGATSYLNMTSSGGHDAFISKFDASGNLLWAKSAGGVQNDFANSVGLDALGNIYAIGTFSSSADFDPTGGIFNLISAGSEDIFILKLDANGNFAGAKQLGGALSDAGMYISVDLLGDLIATGYFNDTADFDPGVGTFNLISSGYADAFIFKISQNALGIKESSNSINVSFYPNPTKDILNIELNSEPKNILAEISNTVGQVILNENINHKNVSLDIKNLKPGLYFLKLLSDNRIVSTQKILKE